MENLEELRNAIIIQAVVDFKKSSRGIKNNRMKNDDDLKKFRRDVALRNDCIRFFRSKWYKTLTKIDSKKVLEELFEWERNERKKKKK